ncbi:TerB family tellurite resistance protein [Brevundimonas sp.]|uniref:tellurite resistance TerB family protein n=1 Tax=Brevundimonas sp. TaxID=1871086 RepID=UPI002D73AA7C|nr:TerB family tellurite resistance protein [Brevundimonas sp.]HYD26927.1 TerB family tellurite resistance protein [Brevundimonas sp.]
MLNFEHFVRVRSALTGRAAEARAERFGRPVGGAAFDDDAMMVMVDAPPADPIAFHMVYTDAKKDLTGRCITVRSLREELDEVRVGAICHFRNALRSFLGSRIVELTDLATGEVHDDGLAYFRSHPFLRPATADVLSGLSNEILAMQACRDEIILLTFVGAADGMLDPDEMDEIVKHVFDSADDALDEGEIRRRAASFVPDERAFYRALDRICERDGDARLLMRSLRRVVDADGEVDVEEIAFVDEIARRLEAAGKL